MPTDLTTAYDHPANFLMSLGEQALFHGDTDGASSLLADAVVLRAYEDIKDVTFAALDNDALEDVVATYNGGEIEEIEAFVRSVRDLLGLAD